MVRHLPSTKSGDLYYEQVGVVIGSASCSLPPGIHVSHSEAAAGLTSRFFIGLFQKKKQKEGQRIWNSQGY